MIVLIYICPYFDFFLTNK